MNIENITKLRDFLRDEVTDERFDMRHMATTKTGHESRRSSTIVLKECGTAACVAGWTNYLFRPRERHAGWSQAADDLGIAWPVTDSLFTPVGYFVRNRFTRARAVETLTRLIETGKVDWGQDP